MEDIEKKLEIEDDVFYLGCIFYELYTFQKLLDKFPKEIEFNNRNKDLDEDIKKLITEMLEVDPKKRISAKKAREKIQLLSYFYCLNSGEDYHITTVNFYLEGGRLGKKSFIEISGMKDRKMIEFVKKYIDVYIL